MTKYSVSDSSVLSQENEFDFEDVETDISKLIKGSFSFPGAQYFNEIMFEKLRPEKVAKFKNSRKIQD